METMKYEEAVHQLEAIVAKMEQGELDVDTMAEQLKKAQELIKLCKKKLKHTDDEIQKLLDWTVNSLAFCILLSRKSIQQIT